jgi:hypothetical protein
MQSKLMLIRNIDRAGRRGELLNKHNYTHIQRKQETNKGEEQKKACTKL